MGAYLLTTKHGSFSEPLRSRARAFRRRCCTAGILGGRAEAAVPVPEENGTAGAPLPDRHKKAAGHPEGAASRRLLLLRNGVTGVEAPNG